MRTPRPSMVDKCLQNFTWNTRESHRAYLHSFPRRRLWFIDISRTLIHPHYVYATGWTLYHDSPSSHCLHWRKFIITWPCRASFERSRCCYLSTREFIPPAFNTADKCRHEGTRRAGFRHIIKTYNLTRYVHYGRRYEFVLFSRKNNLLWGWNGDAPERYVSDISRGIK